MSGLLLGVAVLIVIVIISFYEGDSHDLSIPGLIFIILLSILAVLSLISTGRDLFIGDPKAIDGDAAGAYLTLSRVNNGDSSYLVVKNTKGEIMLLRGKATMPNFKPMVTFVVNNKGEVTEFK